jgi:drug/metabolite transporter (DMT)-like permease
VSASSSRLALGVTAGLLGILLYAGQFVFTRWSIQRTLALWDVAALRFAVAGLLMLPVLVRYGVRDAAGIGWRRAMVIGATVGAPYTLMLFAGLTYAPAAHGAVIISGGTPVMSALLVWLWFGERPTAIGLTGLAIILVGLVLVSWPALGAGASSQVWIGDLLLLGASTLWGAFTALTRRWQVDPLRGAAVIWVLALAYLPFYAALVPSRLPAASTGEIVFQALYQGVGVAILALLFYTRAIRELGPSAASLFMPLIPVLAVALGVPVLGEFPNGMQCVGIAGVCAGLVVAAGYTPAMRANAVSSRGISGPAG